MLCLYFYTFHSSSVLFGCVIERMAFVEEKTVLIPLYRRLCCWASTIHPLVIFYVIVYVSRTMRPCQNKVSALSTDAERPEVMCEDKKV